MIPQVIKALELLDTLTPLKTDCGAYCGGACCKYDGGDEEGMLLFPGESELYARCDFAQVRPALFEGLDNAQMLVCQGVCPRSERPLACRLFPLAPDAAHGYRARPDRRAYALCPLMGYGMNAFDREFVSACSQAFELLAQDEDCRRVLDAWSALMDEYARGL